MKKIGKIAVFTMAFAALLAAGSATLFLCRPVFRVGAGLTFKPYTYVTPEGEVAGLDIDLAKEVCRRAGWRYELVPLTWDVRDGVLKSGKVDCIWSGFSRAGTRIDKYFWSAPYTRSQIAVLVRSDSGIRTLSDLAGKTVGAQTGTTNESILRPGGEQAKLGASLCRIVLVLDNGLAVDRLMRGLIDAVIIDGAVAHEYVASAPGGKLNVLRETLADEQYAVAFRFGDTRRDKVDKILKEIAADGTAAKISAKHFNGRNVVEL